MRIVGLILFILYAAAAAVQYNDPDAPRWIAIYASASLLSLVAALGRPPRALMVLAGLVALVWAGSTLPGIIEVGAYTGIEIEREFGGLVLVAVGLIWQASRGRKATV